MLVKLFSNITYYYYSTKLVFLVLFSIILTNFSFLQFLFCWFLVFYFPTFSLLLFSVPLASFQWHISMQSVASLSYSAEHNQKPLFDTSHWSL